MSLTVEHVIRAAIDASVRRFLVHETGVRAGSDPEDVHQARVATRRLRSDLRTFRRYLDPEWSDPLCAELRWLGGSLGAVRDTEVLLHRLESDAARIPQPERETVQRVVRRLLADREAARSALLGALASPRFAALHAALEGAANAPRLTPDAAAPAAEAIPPLVRREWKRLAAQVEALDGGDDDAALHAVRIRAKRARYCAEAATPVGRNPAKRFASALARVQEVLGEHHDAVVARQWLAKTAVECSSIEAYAVGMLAQVEWEAAGAARRAFWKAWRPARRRELRAWL